MIKVLFIVESLDVGGAELSLLKWLRHCDRGTFAPSVIALSDGILREELNRLKIPNIIFPKQHPFDIFFLYGLIKQIRQIAPDVVHCRNGIPAISYGVLAARLAGIPIICSIHGRTHYINKNFKTWLWFHIMKLSRLIIVVTQNIKDEIVHLGGIDPKIIKVIYNGIDTSAVIHEVKAQLRRDFQFTEQDFIVGTVGNLRAIKGQRYLIEAMPLILQKQPAAQIVMIGQGPEERNLNALAQNLGIASQIRFLGYRKDAQQIIGMFDVFVLPSLSEGFPNVLLEAIMAGVPVVATNAGGVPEIVHHGKEALLVNPADATELAAAILHLADQPELRNILVKNALGRVKDQFDIRTTLTRYDAAYLNLIGASAGREQGLQKHN